MLDAVFMATRAALGNTRIPKVKVEEIDGDYDFAVEDEETLELPGYINVPICVTLNKVGNAVLVDASLLEEQCADANISVMVNKKGYLCGMRKRGDGCMDPSMLVGMIQVT